MPKITVVLPTKREPYAFFLEKSLKNHLSELKCEKKIVFAEVGTIAEAVSRAIRMSDSDIVGVMDATGTHKPEDLKAMLAILLSHSDAADVVVGRRIENHYPLFRRIITFCFTWLTKIFLNLSYGDPLSALIVGKKQAMQYKTFKGCKFVLEILSITPQNRVLEYCYVHKERKGHKSKMRFREGFYLLRQLVRLRIQKAKSTT